MGFANCGKGVWPENTRRPRKFSLAELVDLGIDDKKQMESGCGPDISGENEKQLKKRGFGWPENGEFQYGGRGSSCKMCSFEYGCQCNSPGQNVAGKRGNVKRIAFKADPSQCCMANIGGQDSVKIIGNVTCDPKFRQPNQLDCMNVYRKTCTGANILTDPCKNLKHSNSTVYNEMMSNYCNLDFNTAKSNECIDWCASNVSSCTKLNNKKECDQYGIPIGECNANSVSDFRAKCIGYGALNQFGSMRGPYQCSKDGMDKLEEDCDYLGLSGGECTVDGITEKKLLDVQQEGVDQSAQQFRETQDILNGVLGIEGDSAPPPLPLEDWQIFGEYTLWIIIGLIIVFCVCSISSSLLLGVGLSGGKSGSNIPEVSRVEYSPSMNPDIEYSPSMNPGVSRVEYSPSVTNPDYIQMS